jgi:hypothetical protein
MDVNADSVHGGSQIFPFSSQVASFPPTARHRRTACERSALRCRQRLLYHSCYYFTFHRWDPQTGDEVKNIYMWSKSKIAVASSRLSTKQDSKQLSSLVGNVLCEPAIVSPYPDLTSCSPDARTSHRWIYFSVLQPQQRRRLSSSSTEDRPVRLEPVVSDLTQARWFGCTFPR